MCENPTTKSEEPLIAILDQTGETKISKGKNTPATIGMITML
jgi:hypothetical protein